MKYYEIYKLVVVTSCSSLWESVGNWLTWKFAPKRAFNLCALCASTSYYWSPRQANTEKFWLQCFGWTNFAILFVANMCSWTMLWDAWRSHHTNNMIHGTYTTFKSSEKEAALGLPQLTAKFFADVNSWNVNGQTSELWGKCSIVLSQLACDNVLTQPSVAYFIKLGY